MYAEIVVFFGLLILILLAFAELGKHKIIGVLASLLLIMLAIWVGLDDITFITGTNTAITGTNSITESELWVADEYVGNQTVTTYNTNENLTISHAPATIPNTPIAFNLLLALVLLSVGIYGALYYALNLLAFTPAPRR
jgi:hypothetical protein